MMKVFRFMSIEEFEKYKARKSFKKQDKTHEAK